MLIDACYRCNYWKPDLMLMQLSQALFPGRPAQDLKLKSPVILAQTEREQFDIVIDVINMAMHPLPDIKLVRDTVLAPTGSCIEDTNDDVMEAKSALKSKYTELNGLRQQVGAVDILLSTMVAIGSEVDS